jgi:dTMP kinase
MSKFITVEGIDGSGKSTIVKHISEFLKANGIPLVVTREPGGTKLAETIRSVVLSNTEETMHPLTELLLMSAARVQHINELIKPNLAKGNWVLSDRYIDSSFAYQGNNVINTVINTTIDNMYPDLTIVLDLPVSVAMARAGARDNNNRMDGYDTNNYENIKRIFLDRALVNERCVIVNVNKPLHLVLATIEEVLKNRFSI